MKRKDEIIGIAMLCATSPCLWGQSRLQAALDADYRYGQRLWAEHPWLIIAGMLFTFVVLVGCARLLSASWRRLCGVRKFVAPAWGVAEFLCGVVLYVAIYSLVPGFIDWNNASDATVYLLFWLNNSLFVLGFAALLYVVGALERATLGCRPPVGKDIAAAGVGYVLFLPCYIAGYAASLLLCNWFDKPPHTQRIAEMLLAATGFSWYLGLATVVVAAPLFEEFIFRVFLYSSLRKWLGAGQAVVLSAMIFAMVHWEPGNMFVLLPIFLLGAFLALLYEKSQSWPAAAAAHAFHNALTMIYISCL